MRLTKPSLFQTTKFQKAILNDKRKVIINDMMGAIQGTCKNEKGGMREVKETSIEISILYLWQLHLKVNVYKEVEKYMDVSLSMIHLEEIKHVIHPN